MQRRTKSQARNHHKPLIQSGHIANMRPLQNYCQIVCDSALQQTKHTKTALKHSEQHHQNRGHSITFVIWRPPFARMRCDSFTIRSCHVRVLTNPLPIQNARDENPHSCAKGERESGEHGRVNACVNGTCVRRVCRLMRRKAAASAQGQIPRAPFRPPLLSISAVARHRFCVCACL